MTTPEQRIVEALETIKHLTSPTRVGDVYSVASEALPDARLVLDVVEAARKYQQVTYAMQMSGFTTIPRDMREAADNAYGELEAALARLDQGTTDTCPHHGKPLPCRTCELAEWDAPDERRREEA